MITSESLLKGAEDEGKPHWAIQLENTKKWLNSDSKVMKLQCLSDPSQESTLFLSILFY